MASRCRRSGGGIIAGSGRRVSDHSYIK